MLRDSDSSMPASSLAFGIPHGTLLRVVGLRWITRCWADSVIFDLEKVGLVEALVFCIAPHVRANLAMQVFSKSFDEAVRQRLRHNLVIIVMFTLILINKNVAPEAKHSKHSKMVLVTRRSNKICLAHIRFVIFLFGLLA